jgi:hypothetical protein
VYKLRAVPKADDVLPSGPPVTISIDHEGALGIQCDDDATYEWLSSLLTERLFVQGSGFPRFKRDSGGALLRDAASGRYVIDAYVDFQAPAADLLQAIEDNLEGIGQFDLSHVPDGP